MAISTTFLVRTVLAGVFGGAGLLLAGCAAGTRQSASAVPEPATAASVAARSVWGVVPEAPQSEADIGPELIRGSAVAISENTLLANCRVVGDRDRVGLVRQNRFQAATLVARDAEGQVCALRVARGQLLPAPAYRGLDDLRPGEPVLAFTNLTATDLALTRGWLASVSAEPDPFLETTVVLPDDALSGVLFDARGDLIGLGSAGPTPDAFALAAPIADPLAPRLARTEIGASETVLTSLQSDPRDAPTPPPLWLTLNEDNDDDSGRLSNRPLIRTRPARNARAVVTPAVAVSNPAPASAGAVGSTATGVGVDDDDLAEAAARGAFSRSDRSSTTDGAEDAGLSSRGRSARSLDGDVSDRDAAAEQADDRGRDRQGGRNSVDSSGSQGNRGDDGAASDDTGGSDDSSGSSGSSDSGSGSDDGSSSSGGSSGNSSSGSSGSSGSDSGSDDGGSSSSGSSGSGSSGNSGSGSDSGSDDGGSSSGGSSGSGSSGSDSGSDDGGSPSGGSSGSGSSGSDSGSDDGGSSSGGSSGSGSGSSGSGSGSGSDSGSDDGGSSSGGSSGSSGSDSGNDDGGSSSGGSSGSGSSGSSGSDSGSDDGGNSSGGNSGSGSGSDDSGGSSGRGGSGGGRGGGGGGDDDDD